MFHSPNKMSLKSGYGSSPDLTTTGTGTTSTGNTLKGPIKRKHDNEFEDSFKSFSDDITSMLNAWKTDINNELGKVNENVSNILKNDLTKLHNDFSELKSDISLVRKEYSDIKELIKKTDAAHTTIVNDVSTLQNSVQYMSDDNDKFKTDLNSLSKDIKSLTKDSNKITSLENALEAVRQQNRQLKIAINNNEQRERLLNIEIVGIPETKEEDLIKIVTQIGQSVGVSISSTDIIFANRITPKITHQGRPRVIVAKIITRLIKDNFIAMARKKRITTKDLDFQCEPKSIFINEHLSPYNKQLLKKCKDVASKKEYQYVWSRHGRIFIRKNDTAHPIQIVEEEDLKRII